MKESEILYQAGDTSCVGYLVHNENIQTPTPAVLVAHAWRGQDEFAREKAHALAQMGYIAFAIDMFGNRKNAKDDEESSALIRPFYLDRQLMQNRVIAAYNTLIKQPHVDTRRVGAIGFCFGGLTVIELLRSGTPVKSVVSFHGILGHEGANTVPIAHNIKGSLLILHGYDDPLVSSSDIQGLQKELNDQKIDWQMNIYGLTSHAFTNPIANDHVKGLIYNEKTAKKAWSAMKIFFNETL